MRNGIRKAFYYALVTVMGLVVFVVVAITRMVSASALSGIENKMLIASAASCINYGNAIAGTLNLTQKLTEREAIPGLINPAASAEAPLPSFVYSSDKISCQNLLRGGGEIQRGMFDAAGINAMAVSEQLNLFGFKQRSNGAQETVSRKIEFNGGGVTTYSNEINVTTGSTGIKVSMGGVSKTKACENKEMQQNIATVSMSGGSQFTIRFNDSFCVVPDGVDSSGMGWLFRLSSNAPDYIRNGLTFSYNLQNGTVDGFFDALTERLSQASANILYESTYTPGASNIHSAYDPLKATFSPSIEPVDAVEPTSTEWKREIGNSAAAKKFLEKAGYGGGDSVAFNSSEVLAYYVDKLKNHYFSGASASNYWICDAGISASGRYVPIKMTASGGSPQTEDECKIDTSMATASDKMNGFSAPYGEDKSVSFDSIVQSRISYRQLDLTGLIEAINELLDFTPPPEVPTADNNNGNNNNNGGKDNLCYNAGLKSTSWIICPAVNNLQNTATFLDNFSDEFISIDSDYYNGSSATKSAWDALRNVANTLMAVVLVIIIFSQLTGYGIDNYGIKKMLPRLIIMAIMVNLSFYICELAVDLSNIAGVGLRGMFSSVALYSPNAVSNMAGGILQALYAAAGVAGAAAPTGIAVISVVGFTGVAAVIIGVIMLLVIIVAALMFAITMGIRNMLVVACIILAPIAFALYILPNTQSIFKKWLKVFETVLIIYPLCGALSGISLLIKSIVQNMGGVHPIMFAIAVLAPYAIFFLIPSLIKSAVGAIGTVGSALATMGSQARSNAKTLANTGRNAALKTERFKSFQSENARNAQMRNAQRTIDRVNRLGNRAKGRDNRQKMEAINTLNRLRMEQATADAGVIDYGSSEYSGVLTQRAESQKEAQELKAYGDQYATLTKSDMTTELDKATDAYSKDRSSVNATRLQAAIMEAEKRGMYKEILDGSRKLHGLSLNAQEKDDSRILGQLAGSKNKLISQYGKQMSKNVGVAASIDEFTQGAKGVKLSEAFSRQGNGVLVGMDDDTLEYIDNNNAKAVTSKMLINAATSTTNNKELDQINSLLSKQNAGDIVLSGSQLASLNQSTVNSLISTHGNDANFASMMRNAVHSVDSDSALRSKIDPESRKSIEAYLGGTGGGQPKPTSQPQSTAQPQPQLQPQGGGPVVSGGSYSPSGAQRTQNSQQPMPGGTILNNTSHWRTGGSGVIVPPSVLAGQFNRSTQQPRTQQSTQSGNPNGQGGQNGQGDNNSGQGFDGGAGI